MSRTIFTHIKQLVNASENITEKIRGAALNKLPVINDALLIVENGLIQDYGSMEHFDKNLLNEAVEINCSGKTILPAWCDSHTHLVFTGTRELEMVDKINGLTYQEINARGGGILNTAQKVQQATETELFDLAWERLQNAIKLGTGAIEIKSGYGLSTAAEIKMLRVIKELKRKSSIPIKATFLAAHTYPPQYKQNHKGYIDEIIYEMLPIISKENLADFVDVFCDTGFFSPADVITICEAAAKYQLKPKIHTNQLTSIGGIEAAISVDAMSIDHLETMTENDITQAGTFNGCATLLPTAALFLNMQMPPARKLINQHAAVTLASDYNPGSSPSYNMNLVNAIAAFQLRMQPNEIINASTSNGAFAMELQNSVGSISKGKKANFILTKPISNLAYLMYNFGENNIDEVYINGIKF